MAIVLQDGVLTDTSHAHVREWVHEQGELVAAISLPEHTFTPYGASPKTSLVFFKKFIDGKKKPSGKPVFFARIDDIGYDATGRTKGKSEVPEVIKKFRKERGW